MGRFLGALANGFIHLGAVVGGAAMWAITAIIAYDVSARYFGNPTIWAFEICTYLMIGIAMTGAGDALKHNSHFAVTILIEAMPPRRRILLECFTSFATLAFFFIFAYGAILLLQVSLRYDMKSPTLLHVPLVYPQGLVLAGACTLVVAGILRTSRLMSQVRQTRAD